MNSTHKERTKVERVNLFSVILIILIALTASPLLSEDDIQLPDIVIVGQAEKLPDTISLDRLLQRYWSLSDLSEFQYRPFISFAPVKEYSQEPPKDMNGNISLDLANDFGDFLYANMRGIYISPTQPLHRYSAFFKSENYISERSFLSGGFIWQPDFSADKSVSHSNEIRTPVSTSAELLFNRFNDEITPANEIMHYGFGVNAATDEEFFIFADTYFSLYLNQFTQNRDFADEEKLNDFDFVLGTTIPINIAQSESNLENGNEQIYAYIPVEFSSIRQKEALSLAFVLKELYLFNDVGVYMIADQHDILPSVLFKLDYHLDQSLSFHLKNEPYHEKTSRMAIIKDNPDREITFDNPLTKTPLNTTFSINNSRLLPLSVSYNIKWNKDYHYYDSPDSLLFVMQDTDLLEHNFNISSAYHNKAFYVRLSSEYALTDKYIPFKPDWQHSLLLGWSYKNASVSSELNYLTGISDINENKLDDAMLLSLKAGYRLNTNLSFNLAAKNVLDTKYAKYRLPLSLDPAAKQIPEDRFRLQAGLSWSF